MRKKRTGRRGSKTRAKTEPAMTFSVAEEATIASVGDNRACSDGRSRKNEYSGHKRPGAGCGDFS